MNHPLARLYLFLDDSLFGRWVCEWFPELAMARVFTICRGFLTASDGFASLKAARASISPRRVISREPRSPLSPHCGRSVFRVSPAGDALAPAAASKN